MLTSAAIIILAVLVWGAAHSLLASLAAKARARRLFGARADRLYRLVFNIISAVTLLPILALAFLLPDRAIYRIPYPWLLFSLGIQGLAILTLAAGLLQTGAMNFLGLEQLFAPPRMAEARLVTGGLYRWMRHPLYAAGLALIWLTPVMTVNILALNIGLTAYILIGIHYEENKLLKEFGPAYAEYRRHTPALIPGLKLPGRTGSRAHPNDEMH